jgi:hypothetical protein
VRHPEQRGGEPRIVVSGEHRADIDDIGQAGVIHPYGRGPQRVPEPGTRPGAVPVFPGEHSQPGQHLSPHGLVPGRLLAVHPGQRLTAQPSGRHAVSLAPAQLGAHHRKPGGRVGPASSRGRVGTIRPVQIRASRRQVAHADAHAGQLPIDLRQVTPRAQRPAQCRGFLQFGQRGRIVAALLGQLGELQQGSGGAPFLAQLAERGERTTKIVLGLPRVPQHSAERRPEQGCRRADPWIRRAVEPGDQAQRAIDVMVEHGEHRLDHRGNRVIRRPVPGPLAERGQRGVQVRPHLVEVEGRARRHQRADDPGLRQPHGVRAGPEREHLSGQRDRLAGLPAQHPVPAQRPDQPERAVGVAAHDKPAQRGVNIVLFGGKLAEPASLLGAAQHRIRGLGQVQVAGAETVANLPCFAGCRELFQAVGPDRLQHPEPRRGAVRAVGHRQDRFVDKTG